MWQDKEIIWEQTDHAWDAFGVETSLSFDDDPAYAKVLATWKKQTLGDFVKNITEAFMALYCFAEDQNLITSLALALAGANLFPVHLKYIKEDRQAEQFLTMLHEDEEGDQYFLRRELEKVGDISVLIDYFIQNNLLVQRNARLVVQGKVLNRAHIKQND